MDNLLNLLGTNPTPTYNDQYWLQSQATPTLNSDPNAVANTINGVNYNAAGDPITSGSTGGSSYSSTNTAAPDPYALWGGKEVYDAKRAGYAAQKGGILSSAGDAANASGASYGSGILDFLDSLRVGQQGIDNKGVQSELAKRQGMSGIMDMVGNGIRSGGVMLANKNAGTSSAADAIARAYSMLGARQAAGVNGQYGQEQDAIAQDQGNLNQSVITQGRKNEEYKTTAVNNILADASSKLSALDAQIAGASLPDRINIEAEKATIRNQALAALQAHDAEFTNGVAGITPMDQNARIGKAASLASSGVAADNPFQYTSEAPAQFQNTGGFSSSLPLFTMPRKRTA